ncbi:MAG: hypothetical protein GY810_13930 [Aureispira sp.]|nr:hypothetical protein [Aureispira sp.]
MQAPIDFLDKYYKRIEQLLEQEQKEHQSNLKALQNTFIWSYTQGSTFKEKFAGMTLLNKEKHIAPLEERYELNTTMAKSRYETNIERLSRDFDFRFSELNHQLERLQSYYEEDIKVPAKDTYRLLGSFSQIDLHIFISNFDYKIKPIEAEFMQKMQQLEQTAQELMLSQKETFIQQIEESTDPKEVAELSQHAIKMLSMLRLDYSNELPKPLLKFWEQRNKLMSSLALRKNGLQDPYKKYVRDYTEKAELFKKLTLAKLKNMEEVYKNKILSLEQKWAAHNLFQKELQLTKKHYEEDINRVKNTLKGDHQELEAEHLKYIKTKAITTNTYQQKWLDILATMEQEAHQLGYQSEKLIHQFRFFHEKTRAKFIPNDTVA